VPAALTGLGATTAGAGYGAQGNPGAPATVDTWRQEAIALTPYAPGAPPGAPASTSTETETRLCLRHRRPPEEIEVLRRELLEVAPDEGPIAPFSG